MLANVSKKNVGQRSSAWLIFLVGLLFYCYEFYLRLITGAYRHEIVHHLSIHSHLSFSFLISSYNWTYLLMQIPAGLLLDRYGSKRIIIIAILLCGIGNIVFLSPDYGIALFGRLLVGLGSAFAFVSVLKLVREFFAEKYFALLSSVVISIGTLAAAFSQELSVFMLTRGGDSWQSIFVYSGLVAIPLVFFVWWAFARSNGQRQVDIMPNWQAAWLQAKQLLVNRRMWLVGVWGGLIYIPTVVLTAQYGMLYFRSIYHVGENVAATGITVILLGWVVFSPIIGFWTSKIRSPLWLIIGFTLGMIAVLLAMTYFSDQVGSHLMLFAFLFGVFNSSQVLVWYFFGKVCPKSFAATGVAMINMIVTLVTEIGQLASGGILDWKGGENWFFRLTHTHAIMQFDVVFFIVVLVLSLIFLKPLLSYQND